MTARSPPTPATAAGSRAKPRGATFTKRETACPASWSASAPWLADDPLLTCRIDGGRNPVRIVCDSHARTPLGSQLVQTANEIPTYVAVTARSERTAALEEKGVRILVCGETDGHVDLTDLMQQLGSAGINGILLEGGSSLAFSALKAGIVRRVQAYIAPKLIGGEDAKSPVGGEGLAKMADALALKNVRSMPLGEDFLIEGRL